MAFIIYSETEFDSIYGPIRKGEEINTIMAGPEVTRMFTCSSLAIILASVVFPRPGGPNSNT